MFNFLATPLFRKKWRKNPGKNIMNVIEKTCAKQSLKKVISEEQDKNP